MQKFRKGLPEQSAAMVCKNSLMKVACKETEGWSAIGEKLEVGAGTLPQPCS